MSILKELTVAAGKYTDASGAEKTRWKTIGHLHATKDGSRQYITLDPAYNLAAFPRKEGDDRLYVNMFDPQPKGERAPQQRQQASAGNSGGGMIDDDIPFAPRSWKEG